MCFVKPNICNTFWDLLTYILGFTFSSRDTYCSTSQVRYNLKLLIQMVVLLKFLHIILFQFFGESLNQTSRSQVDKVKNLRGGCSFLSRGGVSISPFRGGLPPPSTQKKFCLRHVLLFKVVRPPVINLQCGSYCLALYLQIMI